MHLPSSDGQRPDGSYAGSMRLPAHPLSESTAGYAVFWAAKVPASVAVPPADHGPPNANAARGQIHIFPFQGQILLGAHAGLDCQVEHSPRGLSSQAANIRRV